MGLFGLKTLYHFGLESDMVFEGTTGAYINGRIYRIMNKNEIEICQFEMILQNFFVYSLTW